MRRYAKVLFTLLVLITLCGLTGCSDVVLTNQEIVEQSKYCESNGFDYIINNSLWDGDPLTVECVPKQIYVDIERYMKLCINNVQYYRERSGSGPPFPAFNTNSTVKTCGGES